MKIGSVFYCSKIFAKQSKNIQKSVDKSKCLWYNGITKAKGGKKMNAFVPRLSNKERKGIEQAVRKETAKNVKDLSLNLQAIVLWNIHKQLGFGQRRLIEFQRSFLPLIKELQDFYMAESSEETEFILLYKLKNEVGVDVRELNDMFEIECVIKD